MKRKPGSDTIEFFVYSNESTLDRNITRLDVDVSEYGTNKSSYVTISLFPFIHRKILYAFQPGRKCTSLSIGGYRMGTFYRVTTTNGVSSSVGDGPLNHHLFPPKERSIPTITTTDDRPRHCSIYTDHNHHIQKASDSKSSSSSTSSLWKKSMI